MFATHRHRARILAVAVTLTAIPLAITASRVSAQGIAGTWEGAIPTRVMKINDVETTSGTTVITLTIEQHGDSLSAKWERSASMGIPAATRVLTGTFKDGVATLKGAPTQERFVSNGEVSTMMVVMTYTLKLDGDDLTGTQSSGPTDGSAEPQTREITAHRKKAGLTPA